MTAVGKIVVVGATGLVGAKVVDLDIAREIA